MLVTLLFWITLYTLILAYSQVILKLGVSQIGGFSVKGIKEILPLALALIKNPYVVFATLMMASSYFLWISILSWFKLSIAFPLTSLAFIFVAILSYFILDEKLFFHNYFGIFLIAIGIFLLLYKQV